LIAYLDSSALIKQYLVDEEAIDELALIMETASTVVTSRLSFVEVRAGLAAARRARRLSPMQHDRAVTIFESTWRTFDIVELDPSVGARAGMIAEDFGLRAGDAIQLASVLELDLDETMLVAWDGRLALAARAAGVLTYPTET
jgi:uncharacterized protein